MTKRRRNLRHRLFLTLEGGSRDYLPSLVFDWAMFLLILANVVAFALETVPSFARAWGDQLEIFNDLSLAIFTVEYAARLWVCVEHAPVRQRGPLMGRLYFAAQPLMLIDLAVILPFYLALFLPFDAGALRVLRILRFAKLARFLPAVATLGRVLANEAKALIGTVMLLLGVAVICATALYLVEGGVQPDKFGSVPESMWWAITTLTTVGYGDVVPVTSVGKLIGGVVMILGLMTLALPVGIVANGFITEIKRRDFVVTWGMVARVPLFAGLDARALADITKILHSQHARAGEIVVYEGEEASCMYFVASGEVELELPDKTLTLRDGDFFGEIALMKEARRLGTATATKRSDLLVLDAADFNALMKRKPGLRARIAETVKAHLARKIGEAEGDVLEPDEAKRHASAGQGGSDS